MSPSRVRSAFKPGSCSNQDHAGRNDCAVIFSDVASGDAANQIEMMNRHIHQKRKLHRFAETAGEISGNIENRDARVPNFPIRFFRLTRAMFGSAGENDSSD